MDTPHRCQTDALDHQYYSKDWDPTLLPLVTKHRNQLIDCATRITYFVDPMHRRLLDLATGAFDRGETNREYRGYARISIMTLDFANTNHADDDNKNKFLATVCDLRMKRSCVVTPTQHERNRLIYAQKQVQHFGLGMPTTCGYYLYVDSNSMFSADNFFQYFVMSGLGCAIKLHSNYYHHFHAYVFDHQTSVPLVIKDGCVFFKDTGIGMFVWGPGDLQSVTRWNTAIQIGLITMNQYLTQRRITDFFHYHRIKIIWIGICLDYLKIFN